MALSPFKPPQSPLNRSRSSSCSSPVRNRIVYQEVFSIGANTLVRSYSCDQVLDKDGTGRSFQRTQIQVASFVTPEKNNHLKIDDGKPKEPRRLKLDHSNNNPNNGEVNTRVVKDTSVVKTALRRTIMFTFLTVSSALALYFYVSYKECMYTWDLERTDFELKEKVFGQDQALDRIMSVLKRANKTNDMHTVIFTGGVGVGKTYASSILSSNFPWSAKRLITYSERFTDDVEQLLKQKLSKCGCNLIIVDDLSLSAAKEVINFIVLLNSKRKHNENLLIILIFLTRSEEDRIEIQTKFKNTFLNVNFVSFQSLKRDDVEKCFKHEIQRQGAFILKMELEKLIDEQMKPDVITKQPSGCKGADVEVSAYSKRKLK